MLIILIKTNLAMTSLIKMNLTVVNLSKFNLAKKLILLNYYSL